MASKTKFFRVAVEGATVDGREIKREWLTQMAKHYDPKLYGARVNVEHIKGWAPLSANNPFGAYGDVIALKAAEIEDGPLKGKMALYAQIDPTDELVALS
ncbi:GPO family capsid scaffolding protein, partial [Burkholderia pseudomallei]|nr:GPO family capsid scaffolding protein [Burkholderia pseudomallei]